MFLPIMHIMAHELSQLLGPYCDQTVGLLCPMDPCKATTWHIKVAHSCNSGHCYN
jgi:hypothetical protein